MAGHYVKKKSGQASKFRQVYDRTFHKVRLSITNELWFERFRLQLDNYITAKLQMIEKQIDEEIASAYVEPILTRDEREANTEF